MPEKTIVILGSSVTALGVAREAHRIGLAPVVFDTRPDIAAHTRLARVEIHEETAGPEILQRLCDLGRAGESRLIATSDDWLRFIVKHRAELEAAYGEIFHPRNEALEICLSKQAFAAWCGQNGLPAPAFQLVSGGGVEVGLPYPVFIRPAESLHGASASGLPKAVEARDPGEAARWLKAFAQAGVPAVVSESLLGRDLVQYSVPLARAGGKTLSFVARKVRPYPETCAVGTYVEQCPDDGAEKLALRVAELLDYHGVAEVEILRCRDSGQYYLIEINARPWLQYALATASGHRFLQFLLNEPPWRPGEETKRGKIWMDFRTDLFTCLSGSVGLVRHGKLGLMEYLASVARANVHARFCIYDPGPFWHDTKRFLARILSSGKQSSE